MRRLLWALAWTGVAFWSLFAFAAYGLVDLFGGLAARNADMVSGHPETVEWVFWFFSSLRSLGTTLILLVWGLVSLCILAVPWMLDRVAARAPTPARPVPPSPPREGVIDLSADQYEVVEPRAGPRQAVPPIRGPR
jgi:hypothetical protein